ncbi:MAG: PD40 domain-containing protein [Candidatus Solibacter usitatus]|nr:PD40 domain-containing protein [Candidatus Solibacter usitatus]
MSRLLLTASLLAALIAFSQDPPDAAKPDARKSAKKKGLPLKPERKIEFTTDEATWLGLDLSRDGKTLLFEILGDLYTLPVEGGTAQRITSGMGYDTQPAFSPDGKHIAFVSDREGSDNLWIADAGGTNPKQLTKDNQGGYVSPSWTPDGEYVLVSRRTPTSGTHEIWMYHIQGGSGVQVTKATTGPPGPPTPGGPPVPRLNALGAAASPDGKYIYYARRTGFFSYNVTFPLWQIVRRDRVTGDEDVITEATGSAMRPVLSPDGGQLVFATRHETETGLRLRDLKTREERWLKYPVQRDDQEAVASRDTFPGYAFTPDGKEVLVTYGGKIHRVQVATGESRVVPFTAQVSVDLGPRLEFKSRVEEGPVKARLIQRASQSPDGKRLAFSALRYLYTMDLPSGAPQRLTTVAAAREFEPAWSPDGQWIAYTTWSNQGGHIHKVRADGQGAPQRLTAAPAYYTDPAWSPDGQRIVALRSRRQLQLESERGGAGGDVVWIPASGGDASLIVPARGLGGPHFVAGQNDRVYFYSSQGLLSIRYDGTDRRTHLKVVGKSLGPTPLPASSVRISPDGRQALAVVANQLYLVLLPQPGGEAPTVNVSSPSVPVKKLTDIGADSIAWADGGRTVTWSLGSSFFRQPVSTVVFDPEKKEGEESTAEAKPEPKKSPAEEIAVAVERPRAKPSGTMVLRGARLITMKGDEVIPDGDIVVTGNRIAAIGKRGAVAILAGARIQDLKGATVMPGIVDVHAHWRVQRNVLEEQSWSFLANLAYGVTTGRDPQTMTNDMFAYQDLVDTGEMLGPRAFSTGPGVFSNTDFQSLDEARNTIARYRKYYRTNTLKSYMVGNRKQRQWVVEACKEHGIMPTTEGGLDLKLELTHALDGFSGNEHSLPIVPLFKDVVELYSKSGITYTPTLLVAYGGPWAENYFYETTEVYGDQKLKRFFPQSVLYRSTARRPWFRKEEHVFPKLAAEAAKIVRNGGRVCIGGHGQIQGIQCHWEMWALQSGGLANHEVLRAATLHGAEAIGYAQDLGSLEEGKLADLMVLSKNPLEDIRNTNTIRYVMKNGELYDGDTMNQVWPQQRPLPEQWWWADKP